MSKNARQNAGLGNPPSLYYTNASESANAVIKRAVGFKENEMSAFVREMAILMDQQSEDVESAIINKGPYKLAESFASFHIPESHWFGVMHNKQKESHVEKFAKAKMSPEDESQTTSSVRNDSQKQSAPPVTTPRLSVNLENASIQSVPNVLLQAISRKAEQLLYSENSITPAPGGSNAFMIESQTSARPHFVKVANNGKVTCDNCLAYKSSKLCAHSVAAAEKLGMLSKYVAWLTKKGPSEMNLTTLVTFDSGKETGKKGGKTGTARRKGGRSSKAPPVSTIVDRPFHVNTTAQLTPNSTACPLQTQQRSAPFQSPSMPQQPLPAHDQSTFTGHPQSLPAQRYFSQQSFSPQIQPLSPHTLQNSQSHGTTFIPTPSFGTFEIHLLQHCHHLVRVCFGCQQALKPGNRVPDPPNELTIVSRMPRSFRLSNGEMVNRQGNVYFHVYRNCVLVK